MLALPPSQIAAGPRVSRIARPTASWAIRKATACLTLTAPDGSFEPAANAEADALFLERDDCENRRDGYQLIYPDEWYTNTEFRDVVKVEVMEESGIDIFMMFDPGHTLAERILSEQFGY